MRRYETLSINAEVGVSNSKFNGTDEKSEEDEMWASWSILQKWISIKI